MSVRPPSFYKAAELDPLSAALEQEVLNEKASTLGRLTKNLERSLQQLQLARAADQTDPESIDRFHALAAEALWFVTIQRELCGLVQHKPFYDLLGVPASVRRKMGPMPIRKPKD